MPDVVTLVQTEINETGTGVYWPVQQVYDAINDSQLEMESIAYLPIGSTTMTFTASTDLHVWPNTVLMWPHYLEFSGRKYWVVKHADLERKLVIECSGVDSNLTTSNACAQVISSPPPKAAMSASPSASTLTHRTLIGKL